MKPIDEHQRRLIRGGLSATIPLLREPEFIPDRNLFVTAAAGSGKTTVLIDRMVSLVRCGVPPAGIVAITFTRKAAGELRGRFFKAMLDMHDRLLVAVSDQDSSEIARELRREAEHIESALIAIEELFIDTIHSFCSKMLRERPFLAGLPPDFRLMQDRESRLLQRLYWNGALTDRRREEPDAFTRLQAYGVEVSDLFDFFQDRCRYENLPAQENSTAQPDLSEAVRLTLEYLRQVRAGMPEEHPKDGISTVVSKAERLQRIHGMTGVAAQVDLLEMLDSLVNEKGELKGNVVLVTRWARSKSDPARQLAERLKSGGGELPIRSITDLAADVVRPALLRWRQYLHGQIEAFVAPMVGSYAAYRAREGRLTYDDLLHICASTLRRSPAAREWFSSRYTHILVDEFQDTDPSQAEVLFYLTSSNRSETDWSRCSPLPGSLFIVGDDKQSIYRFRHADLRVFDACRKRIVETGGIEIRLKSNFRSLRPLCRWTNHALSGLFREADSPYQAQYEDLVAARNEHDDQPRVWQIVTDKVDYDSSRRVAELDAAKIAAVIHNLTAARAIEGFADSDEAITRGDQPGLSLSMESITYGDCMILVRYSHRMDVYAAALEDAGIPYTMGGGKALKDARILSEIVHLLDCAYDTEDAVALLAFLRGPFAGLSDAALLRFSGSGGKLSGRLNLPDGIMGDDQEAFQDAFATVREARASLTIKPVSEALELICARRGLFAVAATGRGGSASAGAIHRMLSLIRGWEADGLGWVEVREELHRLLDGEIDADAMTLDAGSENAVRLLNVHQAKGLESRIVFLADPAGRVGDKEPDAHVSRSGSEPVLFQPVRLRFAFNHRTLAEPFGWENAKAEEEHYAMAENTRLLYVATTRARDLLLVSRYAAKETGVWQPLHAALDTQASPVLKTPAIPERTSDLKSEISLDTLKSDVERTRVWKAHAAEESWEEVRASDRSEPWVEPRTDFKAGSETRGRAYGSAVHRILEWAVINRLQPVSALQDRKIVEEIMGDELQSDVPEPMLVDALDGLAGFRSSAIWETLQGASSVYTEVPFARSVKVASRPQLQTGTIDLVYETGGSWHIVDYKTDGTASKPTNAQDAGILLKKYEHQVGLYSQAWEEISGENVAAYGLWWVPNRQWIPVA